MTSEEFSFSRFSDNSFYRIQNAHLIDMADLGSGQRIVDLACGTGGVTRLIVERVRGARDSVVIGVDHSASALKLAMEDFKDAKESAVQFVQSKVEDISTAVKDKVDAIFFCNAIHYVPDKDALLTDISKALKPGGKLAINTSFYEGAHLPETLQFYRKWMMKAVRDLRREYGLSPIKSEKVEARRQLTPDEYRNLLETNGFQVEKQEVETVPVPLEGWQDISSFSDFIEGTLPGVPLEKASAALRRAAADTFKELNVDAVPRNWLDIVAVKV